MEKYTGLELAVIGMSGRFPGAGDIMQFWNNLKNGVESIRFFTKEELLSEGQSPDEVSDPSYVRANAFLEEKEYFDAAFFHYRPDEARLMDPQLRIFHECVWEALEDAGCNPAAGKNRIGVFAGSATNSNWVVAAELMNRDGLVDPFTAGQLNNARYLASRISYFFNLKGPSVCLDTACSTSLVAIQEACKSLLQAECNIAIAGGVSIGNRSAKGYHYRQGMILSRDGHCRPFDAAASGTVGGEGAAVVVLKTLKNALKDRDHIWAVIKGSGINNDGNNKVGFSAPSIDGQMEAILMAHRRAKVTPESIGYVEAHGTATELGDPIEAEALKRAFGKSNNPYCGLGSVKSNFGHLDSAAGAAGFIKAVLALTHRQIPPSLHFKTLNPGIDFSGSPFYVNTTLKEWENDRYPLRAGVSSFGVGGTNVHVVLEEAPIPAPSSHSREFQLIVLSAETPAALERNITNLNAYLTDHAGGSVADIAYTLQTGRVPLTYRKAVVCRNHDGVAGLTGGRAEGLAEGQTGGLTGGRTEGQTGGLTGSAEGVNKISNKGRPSLVFMFSGQGSQYVNMCLDLYAHEAVFRKELDACFEIARNKTGKDFRRIVFPGAQQPQENIDDTEFTQPLLFSIEYALARLLIHWGIVPDMMIGHSIGEYVAACISGVFTLEDALALVIKRGQLMKKVMKGDMLSLSITEEKLKPMLKGWEDLSLAAVNSSALCVVSGPEMAVNKFSAVLEREGHPGRILRTSHAFHSRMMEDILDEFRNEVLQVTRRSQGIPFISNLSGEPADNAAIQQPEYWVNQLRQTVRFSDGIGRLMKKDPVVFLEVGPGYALSTFVRSHQQRKKEHKVISLVRRPKEEGNDGQFLLAALGELWVNGIEPSWEAFYEGEERNKVPLPVYSFDKTRYPVNVDAQAIISGLLAGRALPLLEGWSGKWNGQQERPDEGHPAGGGTGDNASRTGGMVSVTGGVTSNTGHPAGGTANNADWTGSTVGGTKWFTPTEKDLGLLWEDFFGRSDIGPEDDFFETGGDSLKALTLIGRIRRRFNVEVPLSEFFKMPTIRRLGAYILSLQSAEKEMGKAAGAIPRANPATFYPLSAAQKRLYFLHRFDPSSLAYNIPLVIRLEGDLDREKLSRAFAGVLALQESLRTSFALIEGEPVQQIAGRIDAEIPFFRSSREQADVLLRDFIQPFDLQKSPLWRIGLVEIAPGEYLLMLDMHHIIADGISQGILVRQLMHLYHDTALPEPALHYKDYAVWQHGEGQQDRTARQKAYWMNEFSELPDTLELPADYPRPVHKRYEGGQAAFSIGPEETEKLKTIGAAEGATLFMVVFSLFNILISRLGNQTDLVIGTPAAGREYAELEEMMGMFVNTLAIRNEPRGNLSFRQFLAEVRARTLLSFDNQAYQYEDLVDALKITRDTSRNPLFDVLFSYQRAEESGLDFPGLALRPYEFRPGIAQFDCTLWVVETADRLELRLEYCSGLFKKSTIDRWIECFLKITSAVVADENILLSRIEILPVSDKLQFIREDNRLLYPRERTIKDLFEEMALEKGEAVALQFEGRTLSYRELNEKSNQLAVRIRSVLPVQPAGDQSAGPADDLDVRPTSDQDVRPAGDQERIIGILVNRSPEMIISILAVLKSGYAYLPIDPEYPAERISYVIRDSGLDLLLSEPSLMAGSGSSGDTVRVIDVTAADLAGEDKTNPHHSFPSSRLAYLIYTSGSTGQPKGVMIEHRNVINFIYGVDEKVGFRKEDVILCLTTLSFDIFVLESLLPLLKGMSIVLAAASDQKDPAALARLIEAGGVTLVQLTPSHLKLLLTQPTIAARLRTVRAMMIGGEVFPRDLLHELKVRYTGRIFNMYGPTETTVWSTVQELTHTDTVDIGRPIANTDIRILDANSNLQPIGVAGELCIGGEGVARGYWKNETLTGEKFVPDPLNDLAVIYRTGDLARRLPDGNIDCLGRMDNQVKLRGYRIEPGEIESRMAGLPSVREAVVGIKDSNDDKYLVGYYVSEEEIPDGSFRQHLLAYLPGYMVPAFFVRLDSLPLTPNGKLDRKALPDPKYRPGDDHIAPHTQGQQLLADVWSSVLGIENISITHNFFSIGGNSLKALTLIGQIHKMLQVEIPLKEFFKRPTIEQLSGYIESINQAGTEGREYVPIHKAATKEYYRLSSVQRRLYFLYELDRLSLSYNISRFLKLEGALDKDRLRNAFSKLLQRHDILRTSFEVVDGEPVQKITDRADFEITWFQAGDGGVESIISKFIRPFDLAKAPLMRACIIQVSEGEYILAADTHHIISDATSQEIMIKEFVSLYKEEEPVRLPLQYKDYSEWQQAPEQKEKAARQKDFWLNEFAGTLPEPDLPLDFARTAVKSQTGSLISFEMDATETHQLRSLAVTEGSTLFIILLSVYNILLGKLGNREDVTIGTNTTGRQHPDLQNMMGMLVNTLPLRNYPIGGLTCKEFLSDVTSRTLACFENQDYPYEELISQLRVARDAGRNPLFDVMFVFMNIGVADMKAPGLTLTPYDAEQRVSRFDMTLTATESGERLLMNIEYNTSLFKKETIERFIGYFRKIITIILADVNRKIGEMDILAGEERHRLLYTFNDTTCAYPKEETMVSLFERQAERTPGNVAVRVGDKLMSFGELAAWSTRMAAYLRESGGLVSGDLAGIMLEREEYLMPSLLGVLKAGAAYVPIDPHYPAERRRVIIGDARLKVLITRGRYMDGPIAEDVRVIDLDHCLPAIREQAVVGSGVEVKGGDLAYVIYTSGSTGQPKGVMIEHHSVVNRLVWMQKAYPIGEKDVILQKTPMVFDVSVWELFWWSMRGASVCLLEPGAEKDPSAIMEAIGKYKITTLHFVPSMLGVFLSWVEGNSGKGNLESLRYVFSSGEALRTEQVNSFGKTIYRQGGARLINLYGPTEATVDVSWYECDPGRTIGKVPIGKPIDNIRLYIMDRWGKLSPMGAAGELCIGGVGIARGYLNNRKLTEEKFVENAEVGERIYRTGDLARWMPEGDIEYLGREDDQVKIRGYRIELGEIESLLKRHGKIKEAVVMARGKEGDRQLVCYYTAEAEAPVDDLRGYLSGRLPEFMVPAYYVRIDTWPLTRNGKLDRKALPDPEIPAGAGYVAPSTEEERLLVEIWSEILGAGNIGIRDNFFSLGGDSIRSIQISSRVQAAGFELSVKDIFNSQVIQELALKLKKIVVVADQSAVRGQVPLTPIQRWFFEGPVTRRHHFNQSVWLNFPEGISGERVRTLFEKLQEHHDALRIVFHQTAHGFVQQNLPLGMPVALVEEDLRQEEDPEPAILSVCQGVQSGIDLEQGPLMRLALFHTRGGSRLLIVIHHLVIDGISWRTLLEDIESLYRQAVSQSPLTLPLKTDAYQTWARCLSDYRNTGKHKAAAASWNSIGRKNVPAIRRDHPEGANTYADCGRESFRLDGEETKKLLTKVHTPFHTQINDILLTALLLSLSRYYDLDAVLIDLEGHGREALHVPLNISRTVGWFTTIYPVLLEKEGDGLSGVIRHVKETLRKIPHSGIDYLVDRFPEETFSSDQDKACEGGARIMFNYLGQFDADTGKGSFHILDMPRGEEVAPTENRLYDWELTGLITQGSLHMHLTYSSGQYDRETISKVMDLYKAVLLELTGYCCGYTASLLSPSDLTYKELSMSRLDQLQSEYRVQDIYPLSPMQEGMLFHSLMDPGSGNYLEQITYTLQGRLDLAAVEKSINDLVKRYDILRTVFLHEGLPRPLQLVLREKPADLVYEDLRGNPPSGPKETVIRFYQQQDKARGFDPGGDLLIRLSIFRLTDDEFVFIWSHHHIIMDGWCMGILIDEFRRLYESHRQGITAGLPPVNPFSRYIEWLEERDKDASTLYWKEYLKGYESPAGFPKREPAQADNPAEGRESFTLVVDKEKTRQLQVISRTYGVTQNTILQGAWGLLLGRYNHSRDVIFGAVVSGRPAGITGIEKMIGLFINTLPVRIQFTEETLIGDLLRDIQERALASESFQYHPLPEIQALSSPGRSLLDHILVVENYPVAAMIGMDDDKKDHVVTGFQLSEQTNYDLTVMVMPGDEIHIRMDYKRGKIEEDAIRRAATHFSHILGQIVFSPGAKVSDIGLITEEEQRQIRLRFNDTEASYPEEATIVSLFEQQAQRAPDNIALRFGDQRLTYRELKEKSQKIAAWLRDVKKVGPGDLVGIMLEREEYLIASLFGILMAGAAYVPIDPYYPGERIHAIIEDARVKVLITRGKYVRAMPADFPGLLDLDKDDCQGSDGPSLATGPSLWTGPSLAAGPSFGTEPSPATGPSPWTGPAISGKDPAYVIYTSGSTGKPKGVMVEHHSVVNRILWQQKAYPINETDVLMQKTPIVFDVSVWELFWWAFTGASLYLLKPGGEKEPEVIMEAIETHQVTTLHFVPSMLSVFLSVLESRVREGRSPVLNCLRRVMASGEALKPEQVSLFGKLVHRPAGTRLVNLYGPTEAAVDVSCYECSFEEGLVPAPIGKPIDNIRLYVLDERRRLLPVGVPGELWIAGVGLARGYINDPDQTADRFVENPFAGEKRIYQTGDAAKWLPDGNLRYLGRLDHQVKIRGFRIELGEIESRLAAYPSVQDCVVMVREDHDDKYLVAYYVADRLIDALELSKYLSGVLPGYMVPLHYVPLESMPLNANGKTDRRALPDPAPSPREGIILPSGSVEETLTKVWARVLHLDEAAVGVLDDFFRLGGHSIRAIRLINEIHSAFGVKMGLREVFDHTTIRQQSALLERKGAQQEPSMPKAGERVDYPASSAQERMFYAHLQDGNSLAHNISGIFEIRGMVDMERLQWAFQALVERHEGLRTHFMLTDHGLVQQISPMAAVQTAITERGPHTFGSGYQDFYADFIRPFDLKAAPLVRVGLFRGEGTYLCIDVHHIICDGISLDILMEDFKRIYLGYPVEPLEFRYVDYACWQKSRIGQASKTYWAKRLSGETPRLDLPRSIGPGYGAAASVQTLDTGGALYDAIREFTAAANVSDYMFFLSVYYLLLHKMTGNTDIIIGTDAAGRSGPECKNIVGTFINILPIRLEANPYGTYEEFLGSLRNTVLEDFEHQDFPYDEMISLAESGGKRGKDPLVTVHFAFANFIEKGIEMEALSFIPVDIAGTQRTQYEWKLEVTAGEGSFKVRFIYSRGYDDETIALMMKYYRNILQTVLHNPSIRVGDIEMESYLPVES